VVDETTSSVSRAMASPRISIVTVSFNQRAFLAAAMESVLDQDYENLEYIVVDPGSTDGSRDVIHRYASRIDRVVFERDQGAAEGLNNGFRHATGELFGFLNADDVLFPGALAAVAAAARSSDADVLSGHSMMIDARGRTIRRLYSDHFSLKAVANGGCVLMQPSTFFRRAALDRVGYPDASLRYVMDFDLWIRMADHGRFCYLTDFLSHYRLHGESKTVSPRHALANSKECLDVVYKYFHWAPANRVYGYCANKVRAQITQSLLKTKPIELLLTLPCATLKYCVMNRGVRLADLKQLSLRNLRNLLGEKDLHRSGTERNPCISE